MSANNIKEMLKQGGINMKLVPLGDRVVLKQIVAEETTKSGIVLPGQSKRKTTAGRSCGSWTRRNC